VLFEDGFDLEPNVGLESDEVDFLQCNDPNGRAIIVQSQAEFMELGKIVTH
jgi:hypothetical protein